ncbi:MAG: hypothetical protein LBE56_09565 [Tannerella sp.]|jgi:hypothetical protein|nr:hypothetical protein [Tannerella sp.]
MTEDQEKLLAVCEVRLQDLLSLCEERKRKIEDLTLQINTFKDNILRAEQMIQVLNTKYSDLLTAHVVSSEDGGTKIARQRLTKLVREVEKCIALLNG